MSLSLTQSSLALTSNTAPSSFASRIHDTRLLSSANVPLASDRASIAQALPLEPPPVAAPLPIPFRGFKETPNRGRGDDGGHDGSDRFPSREPGSRYSCEALGIGAQQGPFGGIYARGKVGSYADIFSFGSVVRYPIPQDRVHVDNRLVNGGRSAVRSADGRGETPEVTTNLPFNRNDPRYFSQVSGYCIHDGTQIPAEPVRSFRVFDGR